MKTKEMYYHAIATQQGNSIKLEIRDALTGHVKKNLRFPGKIEGQPVMSGTTCSFTVSLGAFKKLIILNIKTGSQQHRAL